MDLEKLLVEGLQKMVEKKEPKKVLRTVKMSPALKKIHLEMQKKLEVYKEESLKLADKIQKNMKAAKALGHEFWSRVEVELNDFDSEFEVDQETFEIKVLGE